MDLSELLYKGAPTSATRNFLRVSGIQVFSNYGLYYLCLIRDLLQVLNQNIGDICEKLDSIKFSSQESFKRHPKSYINSEKYGRGSGNALVLFSRAHSFGEFINVPCPPAGFTLGSSSLPEGTVLAAAIERAFCSK